MPLGLARWTQTSLNSTPVMVWSFVRVCTSSQLYSPLPGIREGLNADDGTGFFFGLTTAVIKVAIPLAERGHT